MYLSGTVPLSFEKQAFHVEISPLSFHEFIRFNNPYSDVPQTFGPMNAAFLRKNFKEYMESGGFPGVQDLKRHDRVKALQAYVDEVLLRDVIERHNVSNVTALRHLASHIMKSPGDLFSVTKFHNHLKALGIKCSRVNLYEFIDYFEQAYLFYRVPVQGRPGKGHSTLPNKIYTCDTGLLQAMTARDDFTKDSLLENMVFLCLRRSQATRLSM